MSQRMDRSSGFIPDTIDYSKPEPTLARFHACSDEIRAIMGPVGSAKSTACVNELWTRALEQEPFHGVARSRFAICRSTYIDLINTTIKTFQEWIPEPICPIVWSPTIMARSRFVHPKGGHTVDAEFLFFSLDKEEDIRKLTSLEVTGVWFNEVRDLQDFQLVLLARGRCRWPPLRFGGAKWMGVIMDTNPPDTESWFYEVFEVRKPKGFRLFRQPPAIVALPKKSPQEATVYAFNDGTFGYPPAENVQNQVKKERYWLDQVNGASEEWIKVFLMGQYGSAFAGKPVYSEFNEMAHVEKGEMNAYKGIPLIIGLDIGIAGHAAVIGQLSPRGQLRILDEVTEEDCGTRQFVSEYLNPFLQNNYSGADKVFVIDPAGSQRSSANEITPADELARVGVYPELAPTNLFLPRREAVAGFLMKREGFKVSSRCRRLIEGFFGKYRYGTKRTGSGMKYNKDPEKNIFSHVHDALEYLSLKAQGRYEQSDGSSMAVPDALPVQNEVSGFGAYE